MIGGGQAQPVEASTEPRTDGDLTSANISNCSSARDGNKNMISFGEKENPEKRAGIMKCMLTTELRTISSSYHIQYEVQPRQMES